MCNGGGNSVKKFADGGSTGTRSKSAPSRPDSGGSNPKPASRAPVPGPRTTVAKAPNRAEAYRKSAGDRELDRLLQENLSAPLPDSSSFAVKMGAPLLNNAYDLASTALTMTPDAESYVPVPVQRLNHYLSNMGLAGLSAIAAPVYGAAGLTADVANKLGVPRPEALARDLGAMLDSAGILPEGRMLASMLPDVPAPRTSRIPEDLPTQTPAETLMTPAEEAFRQEVLDGGFYFDDPAGREALRLQNMNRTDLADNEVDGVFDPDTEAYAALETAYDNQVPEPNEVDPFDDPDLFTAQYLNDVFPTILERAQRGDPLTDREAFDVMTFERYGTDGVYDPTNTLDNWVRQRNAVYGAPPTDIEGAERMAFLTGADRTRGQNPVATVEGPYFEPGLGDVYEADADTPDYGYDNPDYDYGYAYDNPAYDEELNQFDTFSYGPLVQSEEGIASMYSPTRRAVEQLRQSRFPDPAAMEKQLLAGGAKPDELELLLKRIGPSDVAEGGIKKLRLAELADEAATEVQRFRRFDREYEELHLAGAIDPHVTTFEAPVGETPKGVNQHFGAKIPGNAVLFHIRSAMFSTPGSMSNNVYHLGEIQSDWAQFRAKLFSTNDEYLKAEAERDRLQEHVQNLLRTGYTPVSNLEDYKKASAKLEKLQDRLGATDTYGFRTYFDEDFPAPYVKTTRKWHQLALKQALIEAVNSGADYMSLATGEQVKSYTGGKLEGQQKFYDEMTPREFDDILTKFSKETGVEKPVLGYQFVYGGDGSGHEVPAIRITDEFREAMKKYGLPSFASGGVVSLLNKK